MRFALPAAPSPAALLFLLAAGRELARAGGHLVPPPALALLEWELGGSGLAAIRCDPDPIPTQCIHPNQGTLGLAATRRACIGRAECETSGRPALPACRVSGQAGPGCVGARRLWS